MMNLDEYEQAIVQNLTARDIAEPLARKAVADWPALVRAACATDRPVDETSDRVFGRMSRSKPAEAAERKAPPAVA